MDAKLSLSLDEAQERREVSSLDLFDFERLQQRYTLIFCSFEALWYTRTLNAASTSFKCTVSFGIMRNVMIRHFQKKNLILYTFLAIDSVLSNRSLDRCLCAD